VCLDDKRLTLAMVKKIRFPQKFSVHAAWKNLK